MAKLKSQVGDNRPWREHLYRSIRASRIDQATLEKETRNWEDARSWDHPTHPLYKYKVTARCGLAWGMARPWAKRLSWQTQGGWVK